MLYDILDHIVIYQTFLVLECIHKRLFTDPVDYTWDSGRCLINLIQCLGCKYLLRTPRVIHVACDILFRLGSVQMWKNAVHIDALADSSIPL